MMLVVVVMDIVLVVVVNLVVMEVFFAVLLDLVFAVVELVVEVFGDLVLVETFFTVLLDLMVEAVPLALLVLKILLLVGWMGVLVFVDVCGVELTVFVVVGLVFRVAVESFEEVDFAMEVYFWVVKVEDEGVSMQRQPWMTWLRLKLGNGLADLLLCVS